LGEVGLAGKKRKDGGHTGKKKKVKGRSKRFAQTFIKNQKEKAFSKPQAKPLREVVHAELAQEGGGGKKSCQELDGSRKKMGGESNFLCGAGFNN